MLHITSKELGITLTLINIRCNMFLFLKTSTTQHDVSQQDIPVLITNVSMPTAVNNVSHVPVSSAFGHFSPPVLMSPTFPPPVGPYVSFPPETLYTVQHHGAVGAESESTQTPACQVPDHHSGRDGGGFVNDSQVSVEERIQEVSTNRSLLQQPTHDGRSSPDRPDDDISYRDRVLDDDMSRERLERRLMKEKVEHWRIRDGIDSDRVEFERLRTPHRNVIDDGIILWHFCSCFVVICLLNIWIPYSFLPDR